MSNFSFTPLWFRDRSIELDSNPNDHSSEDIPHDDTNTETGSVDDIIDNSVPNLHHDNDTKQDNDAKPPIHPLFSSNDQAKILKRLAKFEDYVTHSDNRILQLELKLDLTSRAVDKLKSELKEEKHKNDNLKTENRDIEAKLEVERQEQELIREKHNHLLSDVNILKDELVNIKAPINQAEVHEDHLKKMEDNLMDKLKLRDKEEDEEGEKEMNKRIQAIKNAGKDAITQVRRSKVDVQKEEIKLSLHFQAIEKAKQDAIKVIKKEEQRLKEDKNNRKDQFDKVIKSGISSIERMTLGSKRVLDNLVEKMKIELEELNFKLLIEQEQATLKLGGGDYVICGTYTKNQLQGIIDSLPQPKKSKKNKNKHNKNRAVPQGSKFPIVDPNPEFKGQTHINDRLNRKRRVDVADYLNTGPGSSVTGWLPIGV